MKPSSSVSAPVKLQRLGAYIVPRSQHLHDWIAPAIPAEPVASRFRFDPSKIAEFYKSLVFPFNWPFLKDTPALCFQDAKNAKGQPFRFNFECRSRWSSASEANGRVGPHPHSCARAWTRAYTHSHGYDTMC